MSLRLEIQHRYLRWEQVRDTVEGPAREQLHHACAVCLRGCDFDGAKDLALVLLGFDEDDAIAWAALGHALEGAGDHPSALDALHVAVKFRLHNAPAAFAFARLLAAQGDIDRALLVLERFDDPSDCGPLAHSLLQLRARLVVAQKDT